MKVDGSGGKLNQKWAEISPRMKVDGSGGKLNQSRQKKLFQ